MIECRSESLARDAEERKGMEGRRLVIIMYSLVLAVRCIYPHTSLLLPSVQYVLYNVPQFLHYEQCSESNLKPKQTIAPDAR